MDTIRNLLTALTIVTLTACTIVDGGAIVTGATRDPIPADQVRIYRTPPEAYEEIAIVSASAGHDFKSNSALMESAIRRLREEAAKVGANGVILSIMDERDAVRTTTNYGSATAHGDDGSSAYASGTGLSVNRGDTHTRLRGVAVYVP